MTDTATSNRITTCFEHTKEAARCAFVTYLVGGDPACGESVQTMHALVDIGCDLIELGIPFSNPMAEGPIIQRAHERALAQGTTLPNILNMVHTFRQYNNHTPVVLMGYANPIVAMGYKNFAAAAHKAGVDGVLTVDMPPEEATDLQQVLKEVAIECIFLLSPTTNDQRTRQICSQAGGYLYYVSLRGVTGASHIQTDKVVTHVKHIQTMTTIPVCVGFGIKTPEVALDIASAADGVVVGSLLVEHGAQLYDNSTKMEQQNSVFYSKQLVAPLEPISAALQAKVGH